MARVDLESTPCCSSTQHRDEAVSSISTLTDPACSSESYYAFGADPDTSNANAGNDAVPAAAGMTPNTDNMG
jgi:hypothetical protein